MTEGGRPIAETLVDVLETERRLILNGCFDELGGLQDKKERLLKQLDAEWPSPGVMARLRARAGSNLALLAAAREGFAAAQARVRELERVARGVGGYDWRGAPTSGVPDPRTTRRV